VDRYIGWSLFPTLTDFLILSRATGCLLPNGCEISRFHTCCLATCRVALPATCGLFLLHGMDRFWGLYGLVAKNKRGFTVHIARPQMV